MWWWICDQGDYVRKGSKSEFKFTDVVCRNEEDGCNETTRIKYFEGADLPKRLRCEICSEKGTPSERLRMEGNLTKAKFTGDIYHSYGVNVDPSSYVACTVNVR